MPGESLSSGSQTAREIPIWFGTIKGNSLFNLLASKKKLRIKSPD
jgi:hypothetical protein